MRRTDYEMTEQEEIDRLLAEAGHGYLGIITSDGWPSVVPLNYVVVDNRIYFHGAHEGQKMEALASNPRVSFTVVEDFAFIPSHFRDPRFACPATQYYRSVMIRGRARIVDAAPEKAAALQALMEKLQPEGGFEPITAEAPMYRKSLRTTAVVAIDIEQIAGKFKFGQNLPRSKRETVAKKLGERGCPIDHATVEMMQRYNR